MLKGRVIIPIGFLCIFLVTAAVFGQEQAATDSTIEKIYQSEMRVRDHIDTKINSVNTQISEINTKIGTLNTNVEVNKTNITNIKDDISDLKSTMTWMWRGIVVLIIGSVVIPIALYFLKQWWENRGDEESVNKVDPQTAQVGQIEETPTQPTEGDVNEPSTAQAKEMGADEMTPFRTLQTKEFPQGEELKDMLKSSHRATERKA